MPIALHHDKVESVLLSCIYLHNFLRRNSVSSGFYTPGSFDLEDADGNSILGLWRSEVDDKFSIAGMSNRGSPEGHMGHICVVMRATRQLIEVF
jgi:hypothetical protein